MKPRVQFVDEAQRVIRDTDYQDRESAEFVAALVVAVLMWSAALVMWVHVLGAP